MLIPIVVGAGIIIFFIVLIIKYILEKTGKIVVSSMSSKQDTIKERQNLLNQAKISSKNRPLWLHFIEIVEKNIQKNKHTININKKKWEKELIKEGVDKKTPQFKSDNPLLEVNLLWKGDNMLYIRWTIPHSEGTEMGSMSKAPREMIPLFSN